MLSVPFYDVSIHVRFFQKKKYPGTWVIQSVIAPNKRLAAKAVRELFGFKRLPPGSTVKWTKLSNCRCRRCKGTR